MNVTLNSLGRNLGVLLLSAGLLSPQAALAHHLGGGGMSFGQPGHAVFHPLPQTSNVVHWNPANAMKITQKTPVGVNSPGKPSTLIPTSTNISKLTGAGAGSTPGKLASQISKTPIAKFNPQTGSGNPPTPTNPAPGSGGPMSGGGPVIVGVPNGAGWGLGAYGFPGILGPLGYLGMGGFGYGGLGGYGGGSGGSYGGAYASQAGYTNSGDVLGTQAVATATDATPPVDSAVQPASATAPTPTSNVDLVLEDVTLIQPATLVAGPAYRVQFRNQGSEAAGKFTVGILAIIDGLSPSNAPHALADVPSLAAGEVATVTLRLPQAATRLVSVSQTTPSMFTKLVIAVDVDNRVSETDKNNNVAVVERTSLEATAK